MFIYNENKVIRKIISVPTKNKISFTGEPYGFDKLKEVANIVWGNNYNPCYSFDQYSFELWTKNMNRHTSSQFTYVEYNKYNDITKKTIGLKITS